MSKVIILHGHVLEKLAELPDERVHCVVTSPPYWGLRDYGTAAITWDDAWHGCLGHEPTIELYVSHLVRIFQEVRRVLRTDGVCFLNLGDSYNGSGGAGGDYNKGGLKEGQPRYPGRNVPTLKAKDLCGVPWRVALALQADGWWLRSDIIWHKPNPMPESAKDRPAKAHEYVFLLTKNYKYFWDGEAIKEPHSPDTWGIGKRGYQGKAIKDYSSAKAQNPSDTKRRIIKGMANRSGRNVRTVWTIPTASFAKAHFATFPPKLVERCIKVGASEKGICPVCGSPWTRLLKRNLKNKPMKDGEWEEAASKMGIIGTEGRGGRRRIGLDRKTAEEKNPGYQTIGWQPSCKCVVPVHTCEAGEILEVDTTPSPIPAIVLDPFLGSGTTCLVAAGLGRDSIGIELNPEYCDMAEERILQNLGTAAKVERG